MNDSSVGSGIRVPIGDRDEKHDEKRTPPIDVSAVAVVLIVKRGIA